MKLTVLLCALAVAAPDYLSLDGDVHLEARARGPAGLSITAKSEKMEVNDSGDTFVVTVPLSSVATGIDLRDSHMRRTLESDKYSTVSLLFRDSDLKRPGPDDSTKGTAQGQLTLHGVTKPVTVNYSAVGDCEGHVGVEASFGLEMPEHGVTPPSYLGMTVKPHVDVTARFRLKTKS